MIRTLVIAVCFSTASLAAEPQPSFPNVTHESVIATIKTVFPNIVRSGCEDDFFGRRCQYKQGDVSFRIGFGENSEVFQIYSTYSTFPELQNKVVVNFINATVSALRLPINELEEFAEYLSVFGTNEPLKRQPQNVRVTLEINKYSASMKLEPRKLRR